MLETTPQKKKKRSSLNIATDSFYRHAFGMNILNILRKQEMLQLLEKANQKSAGEKFHGHANPDIVQFKTIAGRFAVARTKQGAEFVMGNTEHIGMPTQIEIMDAILEASGPLSRIDLSPGSEATTEMFRPQELKTDAFANGLNARALQFVEHAQQSKELSYNEIMLEERLRYLREIFFNNDISSEEIKEMNNYISSLFKNLITFVALDPIRKVRGKTWLEYLPSDIKKQKESVDKFMIKLIESRLSRRLRDDDSLKPDLLQRIIDKIFFANNIDIYSLSHAEMRKKKFEVSASMLQILFAAVDTTKSAIGSAFYELSRPDREMSEGKDQQKNLRYHVQEFFKLKGNKTISFKDLEEPNEHMSQIIRFAGHIIAKYPPTYLNGRNVLQTIFGNGGEMSAGTVLFVDIKQSIADQIDQNGELDTIHKLRGSTGFGHGKKICKGAYFAIYEMVTTLCHALDNTKEIRLHHPEKVTEQRDSTFSFQNLYFDFVA